MTNKELKWVDGKTLPLAELERIARVDNQIPAEFDPSYIPDEGENKARVEYYQKLGEKEFFQVVYDGDEFVAFHIIRDNGRSIAHISTLWVRPDLRKQGLGKQLKEVGEEWARQRGYKILQTGVHATNTRMNEINLANGFKPYSTIYRKKL